MYVDGKDWKTKNKDLRNLFEKERVKLNVAPSKCQSLLLSLSGPLKIKILLTNITCGLMHISFHWHPTLFTAASIMHYLRLPYLYNIIHWPFLHTNIHFLTLCSVWESQHIMCTSYITGFRGSTHLFEFPLSTVKSSRSRFLFCALYNVFFICRIGR